MHLELIVMICLKKKNQKNVTITLKHFYNAVFLENTKVPEYAIDEAIKIEEKYNDNGLYLEFEFLREIQLICSQKNEKNINKNSWF